jgi:hypothetical protein
MKDVKEQRKSKEVMIWLRAGYQFISQVEGLVLLIAISIANHPSVRSLVGNLRFQRPHIVCGDGCHFTKNNATSAENWCWDKRPP